VTKRILVIDDDKQLRKLLKDILSKASYDAETAANAFQALEILADNHFDLVLMDLMMPSMDGYELFSILREDAATKNIPVIAVTALDDPRNKERIREIGFFAHVAKPFEMEELMAIVKKALAT